jgi:Fe-S cluster assembly protein SufD
MTAVAEQTGAWLAAFTAQPPAEPWLQQLREAAFQRFAALGFPTTHDEEWRFTNVAPIARTKFSPARAKAMTTNAPGNRLVFAANGELVERPCDLPKGVEVGCLTGHPEAVGQHLAHYAAYDSQSFVALNTAFVANGAFVRVPRGVVLERPIEILYLSASSPSSGPTVTHPRTLVLVGADAHCSIVESYSGPGDVYLTNAVTEIVAADGSVIDYHKWQQEGPAAYHIGSVFAALGRSANFTSHSFSLGGSLVRNDVNVTLSEGSEATLNGLYIADGAQHVDNHTSIDHARPHGTSRELYKGILDGKSSAVFNGRILVRKDAQKTDSKQTNKNLVLSDDAVINTKPELQILADDVRCTHGATIGQLDAEAMFYLQSRGIGRQQARSLLTYAFAQDIVDRVKVQSLKDSLERILIEKFHEHAQ